MPSMSGSEKSGEIQSADETISRMSVTNDQHRASLTDYMIEVTDERDQLKAQVEELTSARFGLLHENETLRLDLADANAYKDGCVDVINQLRAELAASETRRMDQQAAMSRACPDCGCTPTCCSFGDASRLKAKPGER